MRLILVNVFYLFSSVYIFFKTILWKTRILKKVNLKVLNTKSYFFTSYGDISLSLFLSQHLVSRQKSFEYSSLELYRDNLSSGNVVLDIGANVGIYSLLGADIIGDQGKVYAFEPSSITYNTLLENISLNGFKNISAHQLALSDQSGKLKLAKPTNAKLTHEYADMFNYLDYSSKGESSDSDFVDVLTVDEFVSSHNITKVDFIKIDIEGAELLCFKGAKNLLVSENKPVILFECCEPLCKRFNHKMYDVLNFLVSNGYEVEQYENYQWIAKPI